MKYCTRCPAARHTPNTRFGADGVCPACDYFERLQHVDWQERFEILQDLLARFPRKPHQYFDCIVGVSGARTARARRSGCAISWD